MAEDAPNNEKPKIITDEDWKAEAQKEKEELAKEADQGTEGGAAGPAAAGGERQIPEASFVTLVNTLATQAMMALGGVEDPQTGKRYLDLELAKFHIDSLAVLQEKTEGNLDNDEAKLIEKAIYELRMGYVRMQQAAREQMAQQSGQAAQAGEQLRVPQEPPSGE
ncbi:MAG: DUF1844 domain-containing protein [Planctomycetes bacterium]|jgi:hypothetical protein|nr:DUF1844 domain-containing protein [Phycisphaerae bacterium]NBB94793.1 DUF1844 domain-containing protein [Planctomycetota bacterium]